METTKIKVGGKQYNVLVAVTDEEKEKGLMDVIELNDDEGCLFIYDEPQELSFWMKNTPLPLLICFLDENKEVISTHKGEPESETPITEQDAKYVLEVNVDEDIEPGDMLKMEEDEDDIDFDLEPNKMYIIGSDGHPQAELLGNERIFSRISTKVIMRKAKKAWESKTDASYKALGKYIFNELSAQESRRPQYVQAKKADD